MEVECWWTDGTCDPLLLFVYEWSRQEGWLGYWVTYRIWPQQQAAHMNGSVGNTALHILCVWLNQKREKVALFGGSRKEVGSVQVCLGVDTLSIRQHNSHLCFLSIHCENSVLWSLVLSVQFQYQLSIKQCVLLLPLLSDTAICFCCIETVGFIMLQKLSCRLALPFFVSVTLVWARVSPPVCTVLPAEYSVPPAPLTHSQRVWINHYNTLPPSCSL